MDMCVIQIKSLNGDAFNSTTRCTLLQYNNGCLIPEGGLRGIRMIRDVMDVNYMLNVIFFNDSINVNLVKCFMGVCCCLEVPFVVKCTPKITPIYLNHTSMLL